MIYAILIGYIALTFLTSLSGAKKNSATPEGYFMANRSLTTLALFFTIIATNFSAFFFLGFAGEGYRVGYPYYVIMALGTGLACLSFFILGERIWKLGKRESYVTPSELVIGQTGSRNLGRVYAIGMIIFTFPYLALQLIGAGYLLENMTGGEVPYLLGATILTLFTIAYVLIGGMSSVASTDMKQGMLMIILMVGAVIWVTNALGGFSEANNAVFQIKPELFQRSGANGQFIPQKWFSLLIFWLFCIPMFPQIFMRFFIANDLTSLRKSAILYAAIPLGLSILPVVIGVLGHLSFPDLTGQEADEILPKMLLLHTPEWFAGLVMTGALAAFMSTLDSQLLALSTIITRDLVLPTRPNLTLKQQVRVGRIWVVVLAFVGLAIAWQPFSTIFDMGKLAFSGLSLLFPTTFLLLYFKPIPRLLAIGSILVSEVLLILFYYDAISDKWLGGFDAAIVLIAAQSIMYCLWALINRKSINRI